MFDFNLANSFGYFELVAMMGGRAFMVERGHFDGREFSIFRVRIRYGE